jgi:hypothetical protein
MHLATAGQAVTLPWGWYKNKFIDWDNLITARGYVVQLFISNLIQTFEEAAINPSQARCLRNTLTMDFSALVP